jgi:hypothetical protein
LTAESDSRPPGRLIFDAEKKPVQLFNLERDQREETNVTADDPEWVARRQAALWRIRDVMS